MGFHNQNRKGMEMAISTIILIIIGMAVLIGLIILVKNGFGFLKRGTEPILINSGFEAVKQACEIACRAENSFTFCCNPFILGNDTHTTRCTDNSLNLECSYDCTGVVCS